MPLVIQYQAGRGPDKYPELKLNAVRGFWKGVLLIS